MWLRDATRKEELPEIEDLDSGEFFPYRWGQAVWAYVGGKYGDDLIGQIFRDCGAIGQSDPGARAGARSSTTKSSRPTGTPTSASSTRP